MCVVVTFDYKKKLVNYTNIFCLKSIIKYFDIKLIRLKIPFFGRTDNMFGGFMTQRLTIGSYQVESGASTTPGTIQIQ